MRRADRWRGTLAAGGAAGGGRVAPRPPAATERAARRAPVGRPTAGAPPGSSACAGARERLAD
eukprot:1040179-Pyramimonas_sp.AAC.1